MNNIIKYLTELSTKKTTTEGDEPVSICEVSDGNPDDAYSLGYDDGRIGLARELVKMINDWAEKDILTKDK